MKKCKKKKNRFSGNLKEHFCHSEFMECFMCLSNLIQDMKEKVYFDLQIDRHISN